MKKKVYILPQTEIIRLEMKGAILDSSMTFLPPQPAPHRKTEVF